MIDRSISRQYCWKVKNRLAVVEYAEVHGSIRRRIFSYEAWPFFSPKAFHATVLDVRNEWVKKPTTTIALSGKWELQEVV